MLFTPLLAEVAGGALEPRHAMVSLRKMCPAAELLRGRVTAVEPSARTVRVETGVGEVEVSYERLVVALGSVARLLPIPGLEEHALTFKDLDDAVHLRNHVVRQLDLAEADPTHARRYLTFVFVGAGYAGVEALAEMRQLVEDALRHYRTLSRVPRRWVLVEAGTAILAEVPRRLADHTTALLRRRGVEIWTSTTVASIEAHGANLTDGRRLDSATVVWTAGVVTGPLVRTLGLPLDARGRSSSTPPCGSTDIRTSGLSATVPQSPTPPRRGGLIRPPPSTPYAKPARWPPHWWARPRRTPIAASEKAPRWAGDRESRGCSACTSADSSAPGHPCVPHQRGSGRCRRGGRTARGGPGPARHVGADPAPPRFHRGRHRPHAAVLNPSLGCPPPTSANRHGWRSGRPRRLRC